MTDTVTKQRELTSKGGMSIFGWLMFIGMFIVLIPLIPIYLVLKLYELLTNGEEKRLRPDRRRRVAR